MAKSVDKSKALTMTLPGVAALRGRPVTGKAMTNAERQAKYRKSHVQVDTGERINTTINRLAAEFGLPKSYITKELIRFALCNRNWAQTGFPLRVTKKEGV